MFRSLEGHPGKLPGKLLKPSPLNSAMLPFADLAVISSGSPACLAGWASLWGLPLERG